MITVSGTKSVEVPVAEATLLPTRGVGGEAGVHQHQGALGQCGGVDRLWQNLGHLPTCEVGPYLRMGRRLNQQCEKFGVEDEDDRQPTQSKKTQKKENLNTHVRACKERGPLQQNQAAQQLYPAAEDGQVPAQEVQLCLPASTEASYYREGGCSPVASSGSSRRRRCSTSSSSRRRRRGCADLARTYV